MTRPRRALVRDVAVLVDRLKRPRQKLATFTEAEVRKLLAHVEGDRLAHAWRCQVYKCFSEIRMGTESRSLLSGLNC